MASNTGSTNVLDYTTDIAAVVSALNSLTTALQARPDYTALLTRIATALENIDNHQNTNNTIAANTVTLLGEGNVIQSNIATKWDDVSDSFRNLQKQSDIRLVDDVSLIFPKSELQLGETLIIDDKIINNQDVVLFTKISTPGIYRISIIDVYDVHNNIISYSVTYNIVFLPNYGDYVHVTDGTSRGLKWFFNGNIWLRYVNTEERISIVLEKVKDALLDNTVGINTKQVDIPFQGPYQKAMTRMSLTDANLIQSLQRAVQEESQSPIFPVHA